MQEVRVPGASQLGEGQTLTFSLKTGERPAQGFLIRYAGGLFAYANECPHWAIELDLGDGHFFDQALGRVYCKNHGALFVLPSGRCETGPCLGRSLTQYAVVVDGDDAVISL